MDEILKNNYVNDFVAIAVAIAMIAMYHVYLRRLARRSPFPVLSSVATHARTTWVKSIMANSDILAVQTLRNTTLAATFLVSTAILLMLGALTLSGQGRGLNESWH